MVFDKHHYKEQILFRTILEDNLVTFTLTVAVLKCLGSSPTPDTSFPLMCTLESGGEWLQKLDPCSVVGRLCFIRPGSELAVVGIWREDSRIRELSLFLLFK